MCGIIGYIGPKEVYPILIEGLKRLEYRGYDSAGLAILAPPLIDNGDGLLIRKKKGKIRDLESSINTSPLGVDLQFSDLGPPFRIHIGIGHTRWATHGKPSDENAHPHRDCSSRIAVVHNGIIENYAALKKTLVSEGHQFTSETDTEVIAHLIEKELNGDLTGAVLRALNRIQGSYAIGVVSPEDRERLIVARRGSPLVLGCGDGENFLASDVPAILPHTNKVIYLDDGEVAELYSHKIEIFSLSGFSSSLSRNSTDGSHLAPHGHIPQSSSLSPQSLISRVQHVSWDASMAEKCGYKHFMLKEIYEQPRAIRDTVGRYADKESYRIHFDEMNLPEEELRSIPKIYIVACGTSYHAALIGKIMIEQYAQVPVEVDIASEFRYRGPLFPAKGLTIAISQSGETADTVAAIKLAKEKGSKIVSICNAVGSSAPRESHGVIYTHAGPEIGVASTKAFTTQVVALYLFALHLARLRGVLPQERCNDMLRCLFTLPEKLGQVLLKDEEIRSLASLFQGKRDSLFLGRSFGYPIAMEGALKLKEISYIHAEAYAAGEMKHGPIALISEEMPVVVLAPRSGTYDKILGNLEEVKARGGTVIAIATEGDGRILEKADHVFYIPEVPEELATLFMTIPLQLLAYYVADFLGCEIDQPRNLAKSVTVE